MGGLYDYWTKEMWVQEHETQEKEIERLKHKTKTLHEALEAASDHLDYCGYGDSWERECAIANGLEEQITKALKEGR